LELRERRPHRADKRQILLGAMSVADGIRFSWASSRCAITSVSVAE